MPKVNDEARGQENPAGAGKQQQTRRRVGETPAARARPQPAPQQDETGPGTFRLLVGMHIGPDLDAEPHYVFNPTTEQQEPRYPSRTWMAPATLKSDVDLVARHGAQKFERVGEGPDPQSQARIRELERQLAQARAAAARTGTPGDVTPRNMMESPSQGATGQVQTGFPASTIGDEGRPAQGPVEPDQLEEAGFTPPDQEVSRASEGEAEQEQAVEPDYERMTVNDLKLHAEENEIDLKGATTKADIIKAIKKSSRKR